ncbi:MAG TPA: hypothetical protein VNU26_02160 [Mycobacteriales bacterium]|nr:hypothetical protein [Mycobacteriales bacterium]
MEFSGSVHRREAEGLQRASIVEVPLSLRVHDELDRCVDLIGERLPDYLSLLLGAAADRVQLAPYRYEPYEPYDGPFTSEEGNPARATGAVRWATGCVLHCAHVHPATPSRPSTGG